MSKACAASGVVQTVAMAVGDLAADAYWNSHNHGGGKPVGAEGGAQVQQKAEKTELRSTPALQQKQPSTELRTIKWWTRLSYAPEAVLLIFCCIFMTVLFSLMGAAPGGHAVYVVQILYMCLILGCFLFLGCMSIRATLKGRAAGNSPPMVEVHTAAVHVTESDERCSQDDTDEICVNAPSEYPESDHSDSGSENDTP